MVFETVEERRAALPFTTDDQWWSRAAGGWAPWENGAPINWVPVHIEVRRRVPAEQIHFL